MAKERAYYELNGKIKYAIVKPGEDPIAAIRRSIERQTKRVCWEIFIDSKRVDGSSTTYKGFFGNLIYFKVPNKYVWGYSKKAGRNCFKSFTGPEEK